MNIYATVDKSTWGDGPWQHEPDKVVWVDPATGLDCMIRRSPHGGNWCGYVGVPPEHPWHGRRYDDDLLDDVRVHGGLTFADACDEHGDPASAICHIPEPGRPADVWWLGFDCGHAWDIAPGMEARYREMEARYREMGHHRIGHLLAGADMVYRDQAFVTTEVEDLARLIARAHCLRTLGGPRGRTG